MKYRTRIVVPQIVRKYKTLNPSKIREKILTDYNKALTPEAITMFFKRHPRILDELKKEVIEEEKSKEEVSESIFDNGTFEELDSVRNWIRDMTNIEDSKRYIRKQVNLINRVCQGLIRKKIKIENWTLKHPDRLTLEHAKEYIFQLRQRNFETSHYRIALRNFLLSKGITVKSADISGALSKNYGKYSHLYVIREKLEAIFQYLKERNYEAYAISRFMFKTGTRITATLEVKVSDFRLDETPKSVKVIDKGRHNRGRQTWIKIVSDDLWQDLEPLIQKQKKGKIFKIKNVEKDFQHKKCRELNALLHEAYGECIPEIADRITRVNHFWRHMFAQHMLRATGWNYSLVAQLGGWKDERKLRQYYGMPPQEVIRKWGLTYLPQI